MLYFDGIQTVWAGILRGMGKTNTIAIGTFISNYVIMQPFALILAFYFNL